MAMRLLAYDDEHMEAGMFYKFQINKDQIPALIPVQKPSKVDFTNMRYLEIPYQGTAGFHVWEILEDRNGIEYKNEISKALQISMRTANDQTTLILSCNYEVKKGYVQFY